MKLSNLEKSVLTLNTMVRLQGEGTFQYIRYGMGDGEIRKLMNLENADAFDGTEPYTLFQRSKFPPFRGWDDQDDAWRAAYSQPLPDTSSLPVPPHQHQKSHIGLAAFR